VVQSAGFLFLLGWDGTYLPDCLCGKSVAAFASADGSLLVFLPTNTRGYLSAKTINAHLTVSAQYPYLFVKSLFRFRIMAKDQ